MIHEPIGILVPQDHGSYLKLGQSNISAVIAITNSLFQSMSIHVLVFLFPMYNVLNSFMLYFTT